MNNRVYPLRNITLDYFKLILAIFVVFIHTQISGLGYIGFMIGDGISRIAVPSFFIINGYYFANIIDDKKAVLRYIIRICILYIVWTLVYLPFIYSSTMSFAMIGKLLINLVFGFHHLWYLVALVGATVLIYFTKRINPNLILISVILIYLIFSIMQYLYAEELSTFKYREAIFRGFLSMAFPFMFTGYFLGMNKKSGKFFLNRIFLIRLAIFGFVLLFIEQYLIYYFLAPHSFFFDRYISLIFLCPILFLLVLQISTFRKSDGYISKLSSAMYFIHTMIISLVFSIGISDSIPILVPLIIFITLVFSVAIIELNKRLKIFL